MTIERNGYFLRRPRITSNAPETSASALPADAGLISGTAVAKAALPIPIKSNMYPNSFNVNPPWFYNFFVLQLDLKSIKPSRPNLSLLD